MKKDEIRDLLFTIVQKILFDTLLTKKYYESGMDYDLTGKYWNFDSVQLTYLFCEIEKVFHIQFASQNLIHYRFITINKIVNQIVSLMPTSIKNKEVPYEVPQTSYERA